MKRPPPRKAAFDRFWFDLQVLTAIDFSERPWKASVDRTIPGMHIVKNIVNHSNFWY